MPPKKNRGAKNDFWFFMQDQKKKELTREGISWKDNEELAQMCNSKWKHIGDRERLRYKEIAKKWKETEKNNLENKFDAQGRSLADLQRAQDQQVNARKDMLERIEFIIKKARQNNRETEQSFFLIHFNILVKIDKPDKEDGNMFLPCEYALVEFSLKEGIKNEVHGFMYPSVAHNTLIQYTHDIREKAGKTHRLDPIDEPLRSLNPKDRRRSDYSGILSTIKKMINPEENSEYPPLFTLEDEVECVSKIMEDLFDQSGQREGRGKIQIFEIHQLFFRLQSIDTPEEERYDDDILLKEKVEAEIYNYTADMACAFHEDEVDEPKYCSLMGVKRWAYIICDHLCQYYGVDLIEGKHIPVDLDISGNEHGRARHIKPKKKRYDANDPLNEFGVNKSRSIAAGVCLAPKGEWTVVLGQSQHGLSMDRNFLEQQQFRAAPPAPQAKQQGDYEDYFFDDNAGQLKPVSERRGSEGNEGWRPGGSSWSSNEWRPSPPPPANGEWRPMEAPAPTNQWRPMDLPPTNGASERRQNGGGNEWRPMDLPSPSNGASERRQNGGGNEWRPMDLPSPSNLGGNEWRPNPPSTASTWRPMSGNGNDNRNGAPVDGPWGDGRNGRNFAAADVAWTPGSQTKESTPNLENSSEFPSLGGLKIGAPRGRGRGRGSQAERKKMNKQSNN